jgi:hypothetical protein
MQFNPPQLVQYNSPSADAARMTNYFSLAGLIIGIVYYQHLPFRVVDFFKSVLGRVVAFAILLVFIEYGGLYHAAAWAVLFLLIQVRSTNLEEGFVGGFPFILYNEGRKIKHVVPDEGRWYVERALGESPHMIEETEVRTYAVDDDTNYGFKHH